MPEMTPEDFRVNLQQLKDAIGSVGNESRLIEGYMKQIEGEFSQVKAHWDTPAEMSFEDVQKWFSRVQTDLHELLDETVRRMQTAYQNYHNAEVANTRNLQSDLPGEGGSANATGDSGASGAVPDVPKHQTSPPEKPLNLGA